MEGSKHNPIATIAFEHNGEKLCSIMPRLEYLSKYIFAQVIFFIIILLHYENIFYIKSFYSFPALQK